MEEEKTGIAAWFVTYRKRILLIGIAAAAAVLILYAVLTLREYTGYETVSSFEHSRESSDSYVKFCGNIVQYGNDGITCLNADGSSAWSKSYEMEQPILVSTDHYLVTADQGGSTLYLFDEDGFIIDIETPYPIRQMALSDNGYVAVILEESDACRILLYDSDGTVAAEGQAHLGDTGYPAAAALSEDAGILAVSYLTVGSGTLSSSLLFYDFADGGESAETAVVSSYDYEGETIVRLAYLDGRFAAFGDTAVRIYGGSTPAVKKEIEVSEQIRSIALGDDCFALIYAADEEEASEYAADEEEAEESESASGDAVVQTESETVYAIDLYGKGGTRSCHALFSGEYQDVSLLADGAAVILSSDGCTIITALGQTRFTCDFGESICAVFSNRFFGYTFVFSDRIERVRLN